MNPASSASITKTTSTRRGAGRIARPPHVITLASGKGGVGKTNLTVSLAWQLQKMRRRVLILDADLGLANVDIIFGLTPEFNLSHVLAGEKRISEILVKGPAGVMVLPSSSGVMEMANLDDAQKMMLLEQLEEIEEGFDYLLIDAGAGISSNVIYFALAAQTMTVVLTPEPTSLADAYALIKVLALDYKQTEFKILINEVSGEHEALDVFKKLAGVADRFLTVSLDLLGYVPRDARIREAVRAHRAFADMFPNCLAAKSIKQIARQVATMTNDPMKSDLGLLWRNILIAPSA